MKPDPYKQRASRKHRQKSSSNLNAAAVKGKSISSSGAETKDLKGNNAVAIKGEKKGLPTNEFRFRELDASLQPVKSEDPLTDEANQLRAQTSKLEELVARADEINYDPTAHFQFKSEKLDQEQDEFWMGSLNSRADFSASEDDSELGDKAFREVFSLDMHALANELNGLDPALRFNLNPEDFDKFMAGANPVSVPTRAFLPDYKPGKTLPPESTETQGVTKVDVLAPRASPDLSDKKLSEADEKYLDELLAMTAVSQKAQLSKLICNFT
ncbi:hypothetical protein L0F63_001622 [Massospora cicadina]|nr:hypothetical protein L0F63_001622 [Massospora cicadina]